MLKKVSACLSPEHIEFLKANGGISKGIRQAVTSFARKRKFRVTLECRNEGGRYITCSYLTLKAINLDDLKRQIEHDVEVVNKLEQRQGCSWTFDDFSEQETK